LYLKAFSLLIEINKVVESCSMNGGWEVKEEGDADSSP
jgi:hypothetical protein